MAKILIAEDSQTSVEILRRALADTGHELVVAKDGEHVESMIAAERPDLVILDIILPKRNGFELCRALRKNPATENLPIIVLSSMDRESDRFWGLKQGANAYLTKPVEATELVATVRELLA